MRIKYEKRFEKEFTKLPKKIKEQFYFRSELFVSDPTHPLLHNHSVDKAFPDCRSLNITSDYRAIFFQINDTVIFIAIGTHPQLYG